MKWSDPHPGNPAAGFNSNLENQQETRLGIGMKHEEETAKLTM
jgi:hypothetical protein